MSIFEKMVKLQHQFNKQVAEDYLDKNFNWNSAIIAESGKLLDSLIDTLNYNIFSRFMTMKAIFKQLNMSNEDVYIAYITKNCLNKFRQDNGYKDGSYIKNWNGREDNVVAFEIANEWGPDEELFENLYLDLETYYTEEVLEKQEPHLSNILDDINYIKSVDTEIGE